LLVFFFFFFFEQTIGNNQTRFITTLAAQLAENIPGIKRYIERAIKMDRRMFTRALEPQLEGLIIEPAKNGTVDGEPAESFL
jgi:hypothetical protein